MKPSGAHTHPGSGGSGAPVLAVLAVIAAAAIAVPVLDALARVLEVVTIAIFVLAGLTVAGWIAFLTAGRHPHRARPAARVTLPRPVPWQAAERVSAPRRPAIGAPREVHLHFHGATPEDVAEALRQARGEPL